MAAAAKEDVYSDNLDRKLSSFLGDHLTKHEEFPETSFAPGPLAVDYGLHLGTWESSSGGRSNQPRRFEERCLPPGHGFGAMGILQQHALMTTGGGHEIQPQDQHGFDVKQEADDRDVADEHPVLQADYDTGQRVVHDVLEHHVTEGVLAPQDDLLQARMALAQEGDSHTHYAQAGAAAGQKAVAFLAGPRERIHVFGNPVEHCPRCLLEGIGSTNWRPHRHIGELKIRYICERHFDDLDSSHHFDIPLCPACGQVLYLYDFNGMLGVTSARRLHKYVLKCSNRHVLPLLDLFCQTKKGGERCNANFKLQWSYGTMVKRCEMQKNRDHDLWWVRYKNEWKQRRTIIRYKKDFLTHLSDVQRTLLLGLGMEGEAPPDPKVALGPTFDVIVATAASAPGGPRIKKRADPAFSFGDLRHSSRDMNLHTTFRHFGRGQPGAYTGAMSPAVPLGVPPAEYLVAGPMHEGTHMGSALYEEQAFHMRDLGGHDASGST
eukprot:Polyplicarium_translucidae@DN2833_c0_g1_i2.p1